MKLMKDKRGMSTLMSVFIILALVMLFVVIYNFALLFAKYEDMRLDMERAANIAVDVNLGNEYLRDIEIDVSVAAHGSFYENLLAEGYTGSNTEWTRTENGVVISQITELTLSIEGKIATVTGTAHIPLLWSPDGGSAVQLPISVQSRIVYVDLAG